MILQKKVPIKNRYWYRHSDHFIQVKTGTNIFLREKVKNNHTLWLGGKMRLLCHTFAFLYFSLCNITKIAIIHWHEITAWQKLIHGSSAYCTSFQIQFQSYVTTTSLTPFHYRICVLNPNKSPQKKVDVVQDEKELALKWAGLPWCSVSLVHRPHISKQRLERFVSVSC